MEKSHVYWRTRIVLATVGIGAAVVLIVLAVAGPELSFNVKTSTLTLPTSGLAVWAGAVLAFVALVWGVAYFVSGLRRRS